MINNPHSVTNYNVGGLADQAQGWMDANPMGMWDGTGMGTESPGYADAMAFDSLPGTMDPYAEAMGYYDSNAEPSSVMGDTYSYGGDSYGGDTYDSFDYGNFTGGEGMGEVGTGTFSPSLVDNISDFMNSRYGKLGMTALGFAVPGAAPTLKALSLANMLYGKGPSGAAVMGANTLGNMALTSAFGPAGAIPGMFGYGLGSIAANNSGNSTAGSSSGNWGGPGSGGSVAEGLLGLGSLYGNYSANKSANNYTNSLAGMYGQNSPYAQQLRQTLQRQDAAAGRRTQYGQREVELQARLADAQSRLAPTIQAGKQNNINNQMMMMQQLGALYRQGAFKGLGNMFSSPDQASGAPIDTSFLDNISFGG